MHAEKIRGIICKSINGANVEVADTRNSGDHFAISVKSRQFESKSLIEQHKMVMHALRKYMSGPDAPIHAVDIKTFVK